MNQINTFNVPTDMFMGPSSVRNTNGNLPNVNIRIVNSRDFKWLLKRIHTKQIKQ